MELDLKAIAVPPVFSWLAQTGNVAQNEMLRTFNCGIGMVVVVAAQDAPLTLAALQEAGETAVLLGRLTPHEGGERVTTIGALAL